MAGVRVLHGYTRSTGGDLDGRFGHGHRPRPCRQPDVVFVCGPTALVEAVREHGENVYSESFAANLFVAARAANGWAGHVRGQQH